MITVAEKLEGLSQHENGEHITNMSILVAWPRGQCVQFVIILIELKESAKKGSKLKTKSFSISSAMECTE